ncbi:MAG: hypothetical protein FWB97_06250, partial [Oscillospiraceae bacterium]|nr:hypothetical protein [Oscillospiraceae bacterium]
MNHDQDHENESGQNPSFGYSPASEVPEDVQDADCSHVDAVAPAASAELAEPEKPSVIQAAIVRQSVPEWRLTRRSEPLPEEMREPSFR